MLEIARPRIILGLPSYDQQSHDQRWVAVIQAMSEMYKRGIEVEIRLAHGSLLAKTFNMVRSAALMELDKPNPPTHFVMLHSDVVPDQDDWLPILLDEMERTQADILSVVIPLKSNEGLTSTAVAERGSHLTRRRRLTLKEVHRLPETFGAEVAGMSGVLLVNSGLMVEKLPRPWTRELYFHIDDRVTWGGSQPYLSTQPEDWNFTAEAQERGAKVVATRKVTVNHYGQVGYPSAAAWGTMDTDTDGSDIEIVYPKPAVAAA